MAQPYSYTCHYCGEPFALKRQSRAAHPTCRRCQDERAHVNAHNARARSYGAPATLTLTQWIEILKSHDWKCAYCKRGYVVLEHIQSLARGGGTTARNCVPACRSCNSLKDSRDPRTGRRIYPDWRKWAEKALRSKNDGS